MYHCRKLLTRKVLIFYTKAASCIVKQFILQIPSSVASEDRIIAYQYTNRVVLWKPAVANVNNRKPISLPKEPPQKLAEIRSQLGLYIFARWATPIVVYDY